MKNLNVNIEVINQIKDEIMSKYGSIKSFSDVVGIKYTTLRDLLSENIGKSRVENVVKICKFLNISVEKLYDDGLTDKEERQDFKILARNFEKLDDKDKSTILKIIKTMADEEDDNPYSKGE